MRLLLFSVPTNLEKYELIRNRVKGSELEILLRRHSMEVSKEGVYFLKTNIGQVNICVEVDCLIKKCKKGAVMEPIDANNPLITSHRTIGE